MKLIRTVHANGEIRYVAQETRKTGRETMGQQRKADLHRDVRISLYKKRYSRGESIFTGDPLTEEERKGEVELLDG